MKPTTTPAVSASLIKPQLPGGLVRRQVVVPPGHSGLLLRDGAAQESLSPGRHTVIGWGALLWGRPSQTEVWLLPAGPFSAPLLLQHLLAGDGQLVSLWAMLSLRIDEPVQFYRALSRPALPLTAAHLVAWWLARCQPALEALVRQQTLAELGQPEAQQQLAQKLSALLTAGLAEAGVSLARLGDVALWPANDAALKAEKLRALEQRLADSELGAAVDHLDQVASLRDLLQQLALTYNLPRPVLLDLLRHLPPAADDEANLLPRYIEQLEQLAQADQVQRAGRLARAVSAETDNPVPVRGSSATAARWSRAGQWLKWSMLPGYLLAALALAVFSASSYPNAPLYGLAGLLLSTGLALGGLLVALRFDRLAARLRQEEQHGASLGRFGESLAETDRLVRQQVRQQLQQVAKTVRDARQHLFQQDQPELALQLRQVQQRADRLARRSDEPLAAPPRYLLPAASDEQVEQWLETDERLLGVTQAAMTQAQQLRASVFNGQLDLPAQVAALEQGLLELDNTLAARSQLQIAK